MKINDRYINEACRIREDFIEIMESIKKHEKNIEENKTIISEIMKNSSDYIENNPKKNESQIKEDLKEQLLEIDSNINKIISKLQPLLDKHEVLQKQSKDLYASITEAYPHLSETDIQEQIFFAIKR